MASAAGATAPSGSGSPTSPVRRPSRLVVALLSGWRLWTCAVVRQWRGSGEAADWAAGERAANKTTLMNKAAQMLRAHPLLNGSPFTATMRPAQSYLAGEQPIARQPAQEGLPALHVHLPPAAAGRQVALAHIRLGVGGRGGWGIDVAHKRQGTGQRLSFWLRRGQRGGHGRGVLWGGRVKHQDKSPPLRRCASPVSAWACSREGCTTPLHPASHLRGSHHLRIERLGQRAVHCVSSHRLHQQLRGSCRVGRSFLVAARGSCQEGPHHVGL